MAWASRSSWGKFIEALSPVRGDRILDVGAGRGKVASRVLQASRESEVYAVDPDEGRVTSIRRDFPDLKSSVAAAESLPFPDAYFDKVYTTMALHHFDDLGKSAREIARVLKSGGALTVVEVDPRSGRAKLFKFFGRFNGEHLSLMNEEEAASRLESTGLFRATRSASLGYAYLVQLARA